MKVLRGMKNYKDVAHVIQFNGEDGKVLFENFNGFYCHSIRSINSFIELF